MDASCSRISKNGYCWKYFSRSLLSLSLLDSTTVICNAWATYGDFWNASLTNGIRNASTTNGIWNALTTYGIWNATSIDGIWNATSTNGIWNATITCGVWNATSAITCGIWNASLTTIWNASITPRIWLTYARRLSIITDGWNATTVWLTTNGRIPIIATISLIIISYF